jgi:hypothetical protein
MSTIVDESVLMRTGCWWGVFAKGNTNEFEISFRALSDHVKIFLSSAPATLHECTSSGQSKLLEWWAKAKRQFWGSGESSVSLVLVVGVLKTKRFVTCSETSLQGGEGASIELRGKVNEVDGRLFFTTDSSWHLKANELHLVIHDASKQETCAVLQSAIRMFRVPKDLRTMAQEVWEFVLRLDLLTTVLFNCQALSRYCRLRFHRQPCFCHPIRHGLLRHQFRSYRKPHVLPLRSSLRKINFSLAMDGRLFVETKYFSWKTRTRGCLPNYRKAVAPGIVD